MGIILVLHYLLYYFSQRPDRACLDGQYRVRTWDMGARETDTCGTMKLLLLTAALMGMASLEDKKETST